MAKKKTKKKTQKATKKKAAKLADKQLPNSTSPVPTQLRQHVFKPGRSGNPKGRPKRKSLNEMFEEYMVRKPPAIPDKLLDQLGLDETATWMDVLIMQKIAQAARGDNKAFQEIFDRRDPKPKHVEPRSDREVTIKLPPYSAFGRQVKSKGGTDHDN